MKLISTTNKQQKKTKQQQKKKQQKNKIKTKKSRIVDAELSENEWNKGLQQIAVYG